MENNAHYRSKNTKASSNNQSMTEFVEKIRHNDMRFELAKTILSELLHDQCTKKEIIVASELYAKLTKEERIEVFGENIQEEELSNHILSHKAINLADTFLKIFNKKQ